MLVVDVLEAVVVVPEGVAQPVRRRVRHEERALLADDTQVRAVGPAEDVRA